MTAELEKIKDAIVATRPTFDQLNINKVDFAKELEFAMQIFQGNDYLTKMTPDSVKNCLINVALTGTTLNPVMKLSYLVPRKGKCCLDMSYMGLIKIITDTGSVQSIKAKPVYSNEPFEIELGTNGFVEHSICKTGNKGKRIGAYSIAILNDKSTHIEWMYEEELMAIKARSESVKKGKASPWDTDEDEMCRKTVIKKHWKYLPKSDRALMAAEAISFDDENNGIDLEAEKKEMENAKKHNPEATPQAPAAEALATDEDMVNINEMLDDPMMPEGIFKNDAKPNGVLKASVKKGLNARYVAGQLVKSAADQYIKALEEELSAALDRKLDEESATATKA